MHIIQYHSSLCTTIPHRDIVKFCVCPTSWNFVCIPHREIFNQWNFSAVSFKILIQNFLIQNIPHLFWIKNRWWLFPYSNTKFPLHKCFKNGSTYEENWQSHVSGNKRADLLSCPSLSKYSAYILYRFLMNICPLLLKISWHKSPLLLLAKINSWPRKNICQLPLGEFEAGIHMRRMIGLQHYRLNLLPFLASVCRYTSAAYRFSFKNFNRAIRTNQY